MDQIVHASEDKEFETQAPLHSADFDFQVNVQESTRTPAIRQLV
jgi:hypothetical protein